MARIRGMALALVAVCLSAAACSSSGGKGTGPNATVSEPPPTSGSTTADTPRGLVLPLDAFQTTNAQQLLLNNAYQTLVTSCMKRFGFGDFTIGSNSGSAVGQPEQMTRRYGAVSDAGDAARYGYHLTPQQRLPAGQKPARGSGAANSQAETMVLTGRAGGPVPQQQTAGPSAGTYAGQAVPAGGCYGEANQKLAVDPSVDVNLPQNLAIAAYSQSRTDPRVKDVVGKWSQCLGAKGYPLTDPVTASDRFDLQQPVTPAEIQQATADVACKTKVNLVGVWFSVESAYDQKLIEQNEPQLTAVRRQVDAELRSAASVLGQSVPK